MTRTGAPLFRSNRARMPGLIGSRWSQRGCRHGVSTTRDGGPFLGITVCRTSQSVRAQQYALIPDNGGPSIIPRHLRLWRRASLGGSLPGRILRKDLVNSRNRTSSLVMVIVPRSVTWRPMLPGSQMQKQADGFRRQAWYLARLVVEVMVITPLTTRYNITADAGL